MNTEKLFKNHYLVAFFVTLSFSLGMMTYGLFSPPKGQIDNSIIASVGLLFLWPSLALGAKALDEGKKLKVQSNQTTLTIGEEDKSTGNRYSMPEDLDES